MVVHDDLSLLFQIGDDTGKELVIERPVHSDVVVETDWFGGVGVVCRRHDVVWKVDGVGVRGV